MEQTIMTDYSSFYRWFRDNGIKKVLIVSGNSIYKQAINKYINEIPYKIGVEVIRFSDFSPNPVYEDVVKGVLLFRKEECDAIIAVGGGSSIDVAKCIKLYSNMRGNGKDGAFLVGKQIPNNLPFMAMPTTAGSGSEATKYAVNYYKDAKQSITSDIFIPQTVLMIPDALRTLPAYQRKATMCDALCHAIESYWSVNSTPESRLYSHVAIRGIIEHMEGYLNNSDEGNMGMLMAANKAGQAINITQTTAGHAMCYKITSLFGCAHGHAAILCNRIIYQWMIHNNKRCADIRGVEYLRGTLNEIAEALGCECAEKGAEKLNSIFEELDLEVPTASETQYEELKCSVNPVRLKNHPISLDAKTIDELYHSILR